jgi:hypothetical protein
MAIYDPSPQDRRRSFPWRQEPFVRAAGQVVGSGGAPAGSAAAFDPRPVVEAVNICAQSAPKRLENVPWTEAVIT